MKTILLDLNLTCVVSMESSNVLIPARPTLVGGEEKPCVNLEPDEF